VNWLMRGVPAVAVCGLLLLSANAFAQGCASCYTSAAAGGPQTAHALRTGILLLLFPPTIIFAGIIITLRRWKSSAQAPSKFDSPRRTLRPYEEEDGIAK
jgi:hypothetical protein